MRKNSTPVELTVLMTEGQAKAVLKVVGFAGTITRAAKGCGARVDYKDAVAGLTAIFDASTRRPWPDYDVKLGRRGKA